MEPVHTELHGSRHSRWQFNIKTLLLLMFSVAVGAAVMKTDRQCWFAIPRSFASFFVGPIVRKITAGWSVGFFVAIFVWLAFGIFQQILDLHAVAAKSTISPEQRWGRRFEVFWRVMTIVLLFLYYLLAFLMDQGKVVLHDSAWLTGASIREAILALLAIVIVAGIPYRPKPRPNSTLRRFIEMAGMLLSFALCFGSWSMDTLSYYLVQISTMGMDTFHPIGKEFGVHSYSHHSYYTAKFFWISCDAPF